VLRGFIPIKMRFAFTAVKQDLGILYNIKLQIKKIQNNLHKHTCHRNDSGVEA